MTLWSRIPQIIGRTEALAEAATAKAAHDIELEAKRRSRVDTGTMRAGWQSHQTGVSEWLVFNPVYYTVYNEYGTIYMSPQPMLRPAIEKVRPEFEKEIAALYR